VNGRSRLHWIPSNLEVVYLVRQYRESLTGFIYVLTVRSPVVYGPAHGYQNWSKATANAVRVVDIPVRVPCFPA